MAAADPCDQAFGAALNGIAAEITAYLASGEWEGKAGGYGIQGLASAFIPWINGSYSNVVGLPLAEVSNMLCSAGYKLWSTR